ncbi:MAG: exo-alpha-sialidase [bacterium]|nr:exo-alpha-sialidase [bacterium]
MFIRLPISRLTIAAVILPVLVSFGTTLRHPLRNAKQGKAVFREGPLRTAESRISQPSTRAQRTDADPGFTEIFRLPFQEEDVEYDCAAPIQLQNGDLMILYPSHWSEFSIYASRTSDSGMTWTDRTLVADHCSPYAMTGLRTASGRIILVWMSFNYGDIGGEEYWCDMVHSDDNGVTWSQARSLGMFDDTRPSLVQAGDGRVFCFLGGYSWNGVHQVAWFTSDDEGETWGDLSVLDTAYEEPPDVSAAAMPDGSLRLFMTDKTADGSRIYGRVSADGGVTWTDPEPVSEENDFVFSPQALVTADGSLILVYNRRVRDWSESGFDYDQSTVECRTAAAGGAWGDPVPFTRYAGVNAICGACLYDDVPFVVFISDRWSEPDRLWAGRVGSEPDPDPPPVLIGAAFPGTRAHRPVRVLAAVDDETGVEEVTFMVDHDGRSYGPFSMTDGGSGADSTAGDGIWSAQWGLFELGETVGFSFRATDRQSNSIESNAPREIEIPAVHEAGNMTIRIWDCSGIGGGGWDETLSAFWPASGGEGYLGFGGLWIGGHDGYDSWVLQTDWYENDWRRVPGTPFTSGPGVSDQDICVTYSDTLEEMAGDIMIRVRQKSHQWSTDSRDDFIIINYSIRNMSPHSDLRNIMAALWLDPDVGLSDYGNNVAGFDDSRRLLYVRNADNEPEGWFGARLLGRDSVSDALYAYRMDDISVWGDIFRYDYMGGSRVHVERDTGDFCLVLTAPPATLAAGDSITVSFGIVLGRGLEELQANADTMAAVYEGLPTGVDEPSAGVSVPFRFALFQNHPNPFNPATFIGFTIPYSERVTVKVYDTMGREIAVLADRSMSAGSHRLEWDASGFGSGVYFCRIQAGEFSAVRKMVLMK